MVTPFWQRGDYTRRRLQELIKLYFGERPNFDIAVTIAEIVKKSTVIANENFPDKQVWLHQELFKLLAPKLDPAHQLISGNLGTLSKELEGLATLEAKTHALKANLATPQNEQQAEERFAREELQI